VSALAAAATHDAFWSSTLASVLVVAICAVLFGAVAAFVLLRRARPAGVRERVSAFVAPIAAAVAGAEGAPVLGEREPRSLATARWWSELKEKVDIGRIDRGPAEVVYLTAICAVAALALVIVLAGSVLLGLLAFAVVPLAARVIINKRVEHQRVLFGEQLPAHLQELAAAMRAGHSMTTGIAVMANTASEPTQREFQRVIADEQLGSPLEEALGAVAVRMHAEDMGQVALVAELNRQTGGNMAEVLDRVAESVRARAELNLELRTLTAQARGSRWIVTSIPPILLLLIDLVNPSYLAPLFNTGTGHVLLGLAVGLIVVGSMVMGRIVSIEA
jgi:tight adherence protein B